MWQVYVLQPSWNKGETVFIHYSQTSLRHDEGADWKDSFWCWSCFISWLIEHLLKHTIFFWGITTKEQTSNRKLFYFPKFNSSMVSSFVSWNTRSFGIHSLKKCQVLFCSRFTCIFIKDNPIYCKYSCKHAWQLTLPIWKRYIFLFELDKTQDKTCVSMSALQVIIWSDLSRSQSRS